MGTRFGLEAVAIQRREIPDHAMTLELPGIPPSTNNLFANSQHGGRFKTRQYEDWLRNCGLLLKQQITGRLSGRVDITISMEDCHPRADASNFIKAPEDLLVKLGAIQNDSSKYVRSIKAQWANIKGTKIEIARAI